MDADGAISRCKLNGIHQQIGDNLADFVLIGLDWHGLPLNNQLQRFFIRQSLEAGSNAPGEGGQIETGELEPIVLAFKLIDAINVANQASYAVHLLMAMGEALGRDFPDPVEHCLEFNQEFISQLTLHMYNAKERSQFNLSYPNPIAEQIKSEYAPIYDMAVYFSHIFSKKYNITLSESEIAFITFHFGAYLENNQNHQSAFTCIIIVEDYLNFQKNIVQQIEKNFRNELIIRQVMSSIQYWVLKPDCDLLISTLDIPSYHHN